MRVLGGREGSSQVIQLQPVLLLEWALKPRSASRGSAVFRRLPGRRWRAPALGSAPSPRCTWGSWAWVFHTLCLQGVRALSGEQRIRDDCGEEGMLVGVVRDAM